MTAGHDLHQTTLQSRTEVRVEAILPMRDLVIAVAEAMTTTIIQDRTPDHTVHLAGLIPTATGITMEAVRIAEAQDRTLQGQEAPAEVAAAILQEATPEAAVQIPEAQEVAGRQEEVVIKILLSTI